MPWPSNCTESTKSQLGMLFVCTCGFSNYRARTRRSCDNYVPRPKVLVWRDVACRHIHQFIRHDMAARSDVVGSQYRYEAFHVLQTSIALVVGYTSDKREEFVTCGGVPVLGWTNCVNHSAASLMSVTSSSACS